MHKHIFGYIFALLCVSNASHAQLGLFDTEREEIVIINGQKIPVIIKGRDTIIMARLDEVQVNGTRLFKNDVERYRFNQMRYNVKKILPYAIEALKLYQDLQNDTKDMKAGKKRRRVQDAQKEMQNRFEKPLKNLYRSQGTLLIKILERATNRPMYDIISEYKGGLTAFYWNSVGYFFEYNLKEGYNPEKDPMMESVLKEFDLKALVEQKRKQDAATTPANPPVPTSPTNGK